jgi:hypothetical protein
MVAHMPIVCKAEESDSSILLLPMSLPFPSVEGSLSPLAARGHKRQREAARRSAMRWANRIIALFNFYICPDSFKGNEVPRWAHKLLWAMQRDAADSLYSDLLRFARLAPVDPSGGGRGYFKLDALLKSISATLYSGHAPLERLLSGALSVKPEKVSLPEVAGQFPPEFVLPEPLRIEFLDLKGRWVPAHQWGPTVQACHKILVEAEIILFKKLWDAKMIDFMPEDKLYLYGPKNRRELRCGGFFCVPHKSHKDRLIYDRRPRNATEEKVCVVTVYPWGAVHAVGAERDETFRG